MIPLFARLRHFLTAVAAVLAGALVVTQAAVDTAAQALKAAVLALAEAQAAEAQAHLEVLRNG